MPQEQVTIDDCTLVKHLPSGKSMLVNIPTLGDEIVIAHSQVTDDSELYQASKPGDTGTLSITEWLHNKLLEENGAKRQQPLTAKDGGKRDETRKAIKSILGQARKLIREAEQKLAVIEEIMAREARAEKNDDDDLPF